MMGKSYHVGEIDQRSDSVQAST